MEELKEIWKDIEGYEGKYQVSNLGNVRSLNYNKTGKIKLLSPGYSRGYCHVKLWDENKKSKCIKIHRLVAQAFINNYNNYLYVNHKDENKSNNNANNLEWCTNEYNAHYGTAIERKRMSLLGHVISNETKTKMSVARKGKGKGCICVTTKERFNTLREASIYYNISESNISGCCRKIRNTAGKSKDGTPLVWKFNNFKG